MTEWRGGHYVSHGARSPHHFQMSVATQPPPRALGSASPFQTTAILQIKGGGGDVPPGGTSQDPSLQTVLPELTHCTGLLPSTPAGEEVRV